MPAYGIQHTLGEGPWHYCARCENKAKLNTELQWQNSLLLCDDCRDQKPVLLGSIEAARARELETLIASPDLRPSEKLVNPQAPSFLDDDIYI